MSQDNRFARFRDFVKVETVKVDPEKKLLFECKDSTSTTGYSLDILADVTFSGILTANKAMYLPTELDKAKDTFWKPYGKPVQLHHSDHMDPVGRVQKARYIDTSSNVISKDSRVKDFVSKDFSLFMLKDKASAFSEIAMLSQNESYTGLGRIRAHLSVTDSEAISKILDGRYLTLSSGFRTKEAWCSSCLTEDEAVDWVKDGPCDHELGENYKGIPTFLIPKMFRYDEVSFVNNPALPMSQVVELHTSGFEDKVDHKIELVRNGGHDIKVFLNMFVRKQDKDNLESVIRIEDGQDINILDHRDMLKDLLMLDEMTDHPHIKEQLEENDHHVEEGVVETGVSAPNEDKRENNMYSLKEVTKDSASNYELVANHLEDQAKLTKEALAELKDSVFLGPERTFPVPDLVHAEAVRKLLDELESAAGFKDLMIEYLDRRVAKLGESQGETEITNSANVIDDGKVVEDTTEGDDPAAKFAEEITSLKDKLEEKDQMISLLKRRADILEDELNKAHTEHLELTKQAHTLLAEKVVDRKVALGHQVEDRDVAIKEHESRTWESLNDSLRDLQDADRADGLARETSTEAVVEDPTANGVATSTDLTGFSRIVDDYKELLKWHGKTRADMWLGLQKARGYFPADAVITE